MADTWRENAIVLAILIIADKKIAQAGYDKTIKGLINKVIDSASGKYLIRYQDSLFEAYATSSKITYNKDLEVSVLIPGNDWDRVKTILNSISSNANNYKQVPIVSDSYNTIGPNGSSLSLEIQLSSYISLSKVLLDGQGISFNDISNYIKRGDAIALGMKIRTAFTDGQVGGLYGLRFNLIFKDDVNKELIIKTYTVSNMDVIGHPYQLINSQWVLTLITDIDTENFIGVSSIEAYCDGFPLNENKADIKDIFISDIKINGADVLSDLDLNNTILHINDSTNGNTLEGDITELPLIALLKVNGKITTLNVVYYWFRENGTIFRGNDRYSGYAGDGWECLNYKDGNSFVPKSSNTFIFNSIEDNLANDSALAPQKITKILCVAVYNNRDWIKGLILINNNFITDDIVIRVKEGLVYTDRTTYFLDNGYPDLVCETNLEGSLEYIWSVKPARGRAEQVIEDSLVILEVAAAVSTWKEALKKRDWMAPANARDFVLTDEYINAKNNFDQAQITPYISGDTYYNFPIKSIIGYSTISCAVKEDEQYKGTASIVLYNKTQLEGMYSLNLEHGTQVFQYDGKGNSPTSPQLERKLEIQPLSFNLINNDGLEIPYDQIVNNGYVKWIIPNTQTLLKGDESKEHVTGELDIIVTRADLSLAARDYDVYSNLSQFSYFIEDQYDSKKNINYIWLHIKYKDMLFDAYTNFTFPKDGDPGTNGTDFVAKIGSDDSFDRLYISNKNISLLFNDQGSKVEKLVFLLYNNSIKNENNLESFWTTPPKTRNENNKEDIKVGRKSYLSVNPGYGSTTTVTFNNNIEQTFNEIKNDAPINIIRAQYGIGNNSGDLRYYAEIPICTNYIKTNEEYRIKVKPKTGFNYVVYNSDGTSPSYDNTMPFEILVEKLVGLYYMKEQEVYTYTFDIIGNLKNGVADGNKYIVLPKDTYDGYDLTSAIICQVKRISDNIEVGFIHIPIYMIINRYNNRALNSWDGNSVQIDANGKGLILTPQIAAGAKDTNNAFTGMLMGQIALNSSDDNIGKNGDIGIMGYDSGVRTVFLDAKTGKAEFGKNNQGKIIIDPDTKINNQAAALLYSNTYPLNYFLQHPNVETVGEYYKNNRTAKGLLIDLSTPQIGYGNGNFTVNSEGHLIARGGGLIAGWTLADTKLHKDNKVGMASSDEMVPTDIGLKNGNDDTTAFWAGGTLNTSGTNNGKLKSANFYVTHGGYLYSKLGRIAKWNINENTLLHTDGKVGMGTGSNKTFHYTDSSNNSTSISITNPRFWAINGNKLCIIDDNGKLWANEARIGPWLVDQSKLSNGYTGLGSNLISSTDMNNAFGSGTTSNGIQARIWASTANTNKSVNFVVSNDGKLYSKAGKIGGWNIEEDKLWAGSKTQGTAGIQINAKGSLTGGLQITTGNNAHNYTWAISENGTATFNNLNANNTGTIAGWKINSIQLSSPDNSMVIQKKGAISGPSWSIDLYGNASFSYIRGSIASTGGSNVSLTGGGGYGSGGYTLRSDGYLGVGSSGQGMVFSGGNLTVTGTIQAKAGYIGSGSSVWSIDEKGIVNGSNHVYPTGIVIGNSEMNGEVIQAHTRFDVAGGGSGNQGQTGHIKFSDGADIYVKGGIIVSVSPGEDVIWG